MAEKRQSSLLAWLKDGPFPKMARVSEVRDNETDNEECDVEEADYSTSDDSMREADEAETTESLQDTDCSTETTLLNCTARCCLHSDEVFQPIDKKTINIYHQEKKFSTAMVQTVPMGKHLHHLQESFLPVLSACY